jgi:tripartite-type tricarboxylate transporter receptor subunit TctC
MQQPLSLRIDPRIIAQLVNRDFIRPIHADYRAGGAGLVAASEAVASAGAKESSDPPR